uniref:GILT-like protein F37H8.5 n=1 Tax=Dracunculus medinensis TaxID=318479 RepID=A0A0N4U339_DRAME
LVVGCVFYLSFNYSKFSVNENMRSGNKKSQLSVYLEAQCGDSTHFLLSQLKPFWLEFIQSERIDFEIIPFGKARCVPVVDDFKRRMGKNFFRCVCQHGPEECLLNQLMNCVIDELYVPERYFPILFCLQGKMSQEEGVRDCLLPSRELPIQRLINCGSTIQGRRLLAQAGDKTASLNPKLSFVPWILVDGVRSVDALYNLKEVLCAKLIPSPRQCNAI